MPANSQRIFVLDENNKFTAEQIKKIKELIDAGKDEEAKAYIHEGTAEIFKKMWKDADQPKAAPPKEN